MVSFSVSFANILYSINDHFFFFLIVIRISYFSEDLDSHLTNLREKLNCISIKLYEIFIMEDIDKNSFQCLGFSLWRYG